MSSPGEEEENFNVGTDDDFLLDSNSDGANNYNY